MTRVPRQDPRLAPPAQALDVIDVRLWGSEASVTRHADMIGGLPGVTVLTRHGPVAARRGSGQRIYLTVLLADPSDMRSPP